jgi:pyrimidine-specific ribonucleoside hydrolase
MRDPGFSFARQVVVVTLSVVACLAAGCQTASPTTSPAASTPPAPSTPTRAPTSTTASPIQTPLPPPSTTAGSRRPLLIDTDVAPDDLVAIAFLVASPNVRIEAITVSGTGEAHCAGGVDVVLRLLERLDSPQIDVACGRETPIAGNHAFPDAWRENADNGADLDLPPTSRHAADVSAVALIGQTALEVDGLYVLTLGPLTNLAEAVAVDPILVERIESVYTMGGALFVPGNVAFGGPPDNEVAEWNIYVDPTALQQVIDAGLRIRLISLDGTNQAPVTPEFADRVQGEAAGSGARVLAELFAAHPFMTDGTYSLWDPLAAALAAGYPVGSFTAAHVDVEEAEGPAYGFTRPVDGAANVEYLSTVDAALAENTLLEVLNL